MNIKYPILALTFAALAAASVGACGSDSSQPPPTCGNNVAEDGEACDGMDLHGQTCASLYMNQQVTGLLSCANCVLVTSACSPPPGAGGSPGASGAPGSGGGPGMGTGTGGGP